MQEGWLCYVVNYSKQKLKNEVGKITNGEFCDVIYEPVGGEIFNECVRCVATKGYARFWPSALPLEPFPSSQSTWR